VKFLLVVAFLFPLHASLCHGQDPRRSQRAELMQMVGATEIRVRYIRPVARGRALFGSLVPYGRVWTPSADSALRISFSTDVEIAGRTLPSGSYSLWAIPDSTQWTLIFNKTSNAFHIGGYSQADDALRVTAKVDSLPHVETLSLGFPVVDGRRAVMQIHWGTAAVKVEIGAK
jgi:DUF2911 family protein